MFILPINRHRLITGVVAMVVILLTPVVTLSQTTPAAGDRLSPNTRADGWIITQSVPMGDVTAEVAIEAPVRDKSAYPRLESQLAQLYESAILGKGRPLETFAGQRHIDLAAGTARVILVMDADPEAHPAGPAWIETIDLGNGQTAQIEHAPPIAIRADLLAAIEATGARYETAYQNWVQVLAPFASLVALSEIEGVGWVRLPYPARTLEMPAVPRPNGAAPAGGNPEAGYDDSEGVALTNAANWIAQGYNGSGINLAVFDFGFTGYAGLQASGDLPTGSMLVLKDYSAEYTFGQEDPYGDYDHGAACAEIAHDMAPGAKMYLYAFSTDVEFGNAVADYETNAGITGKKVATMSIGWVNAGPYDGTGPIADIVNTAASTYSIFWANSAGNNRKSHHSWTSAQYGTGDSVAFGNGNVEGFGPEPGQVYNFPVGSYITVFLEWNDWNSGRTGNQNHIDYDLYLLRWTGSSWTTVASSVEDQCTTSIEPTEAIGFQVTTAGYYGILIQRYVSGCPNNFGHWMQLHSFLSAGDQPLFWYSNECNSVTIPADANGAMAAGAVDWYYDSTGPDYGLEYFSSLGPRNASGGGNPGTTRAKVDVVAPDMVSTLTYGAEGFGGTSAASPHVAGLAATAWQAYPDYTLAQITDYIKTQAADRPLGACGGSAGNDNCYGEGRINLPAPSTNTWTGATSTDWNTASNWSSGAVPLGNCSTNVLIPTNPSGGRFPTLTAESWVKDLTIQSGASLDGGSQTLHVCGNWANSGTFTGGTGTVNFMGTTTMSGGSTANNFNNVTISPGKSLNLGNESLNVAGDWSDYGGTLTPGTSTVTFNKAGTQAVSTYALGSYTTLLSENFASTTFPPTDWGKADTYGTVGDWTRNTSRYYSEPASARFTYSTQYYAATRLYSPVINLSGYYNNRLTFYMYHDTTSNASDFVQVEVSTDGGTTFNDVGEPIYRYTGSTGWTQHIVDLSIYDNASSVRVSFEGVNYGGYYMYIDDVAVQGQPLSLADSTFYNLAVASGSTTVTGRNVTVNNDLTINEGGMLDVNTYKVLAVGGTYTYLTGWLSNSETRSVGTTAVDFFDGRGTAMTNPTARLTRDSGSSDYTVTTRAGWQFPANDFGTTCPSVSNAVWRYYNIVPTSSAATTVRLYYLDTELNGNTEANLKIWHCTGGSWHEQTGGTLTRDTSANWVEMTNVSDFSPFVLSENTPTAIKLARFAAWPEGKALHVEWETVSEIDAVGFNLYRSNAADGPYTRLNPELIPSQAPGSPIGAVYTWNDTAVQPGVTYYYKLEDVDTHGMVTLHGPVWTALPPSYTVYLPVVNK